MKIQKILLLGLVSVLSLGTISCDQLSLQPAPSKGGAKKTAPKPAAKPAIKAQPQQQQPRTTQAQPQQPRPSISDDINGVVNYGIGATQLKAKQNMTNKIKAIQDQQNQRHMDALK